MFKVYVDSEKVRETGDRTKALETFEAHKDMIKEGFGNIDNVRLYKDDSLVRAF